MKRDRATPALVGFVMAGLVAVGAYAVYGPQPTAPVPAPQPAPVKPVKPKPVRDDAPPAAQPAGDYYWSGDFAAGGPTYKGNTVQVYLPETEHLKNQRGTDGAGLCVFYSLEHAAIYQNVKALLKVGEFMQKYPGGGWPEKVAEVVPRCAAAYGYKAPELIQVTNGDFDIADLALRTGRYVCTTYCGLDNVFYRQKVAHMVNLVFLSREYACLHDNNFPGKYLWMSRKEYEDRAGGKNAWLIILTGAPPPAPMASEALFTSFRGGPPPGSPYAGGDCPECEVAARARLARQLPPAQWQLPTVQWQQPQPAPQFQPVQPVQQQQLPGKHLVRTHAGQLVQCEVVYAPADGVEWIVSPNPGDGLLLVERNRVLGGLDQDTGVYTALDNGRWSFTCPPPYPAPAPRRGGGNGGGNSGRAPLERAGDLVFGVDWKKVEGSPAYMVGTRAATRIEAIAAVSTSGLTDDREKVRVTAVSIDEPLRSKVVRDLETHPALAEWRDRVLPQDYPPGHWAVAAWDKSETIYVQSGVASDGRAKLLDQMPLAEYTPEKFARFLNNIGRRPAPSAAIDPTLLLLGGLVALAVILAVALAVRPKEKNR